MLNKSSRYCMTKRVTSFRYYVLLDQKGQVHQLWKNDSLKMNRWKSYIDWLLIGIGCTEKEERVFSVLLSFLESIRGMCVFVVVVVFCLSTRIVSFHINLQYRHAKCSMHPPSSIRNSQFGVVHYLD